MACRLLGAMPLSESVLPYCQLDPKEHIPVKFYSKLFFFHGNAQEKVVCKMAAIVSRSQCAKTSLWLVKHKMGKWERIDIWNEIETSYDRKYSETCL